MITGITKIPYLINKHGAREIIAITQEYTIVENVSKDPQQSSYKNKKNPLS